MQSFDVDSVCVVSAVSFFFFLSEKYYTEYPDVDAKICLFDYFFLFFLHPDLCAFCVSVRNSELRILGGWPLAAVESCC